MRHILLVAAIIVGIFIGASAWAAVESGELTWQGGFGLFGGIELVLMLILEAVLFCGWVLACEIAHSRRLSEEQTSELNKKLRKLRDVVASDSQTGV